MNHQSSLTPVLRQVTLPPIACPNCSINALVALSTLQVIPQSILSQGMVGHNREAVKAKAKIIEQRVICFSCGYRAHLVLNKAGNEYVTAWESLETPHPHGGLLAEQQAP